MKVIKVTLNDGLWDCARREAIRKGNSATVSQYVASLMRTGLRAHLNKNEYKAVELDK